MGTSTGFEPMVSGLALRYSTNWAMKIHTLGAGQVVAFIFNPWMEWNFVRRWERNPGRTAFMSMDYRLVTYKFHLKAHVHPNGFARLCFCFETILLSNAVFWLASTFEERCVTMLKTTARKTSFFHAWPKLTVTVWKRPVRLTLFQMEEDISPTSLNVTGESSSKFKLIVNAYGCFVESDEHNEGHKITKCLSTTWDFPEARFDCEMFWFLNLLFCVNS